MEIKVTICKVIVFTDYEFISSCFDVEKLDTYYSLGFTCSYTDVIDDKLHQKYSIYYFNHNRINKKLFDTLGSDGSMLIIHESLFEKIDEIADLLKNNYGGIIDILHYKHPIDYNIVSALDGWKLNSVILENEEIDFHEEIKKIGNSKRNLVDY